MHLCKGRCCTKQLPSLQILVLELLVCCSVDSDTRMTLQAKKRRKKVERRASKGRKLRYQVMEKLVHFMTPVPRPETTMAPQLFSNLFGQSMNSR